MWLDIGMVALFVFAGYAFLQVVGWRTRGLSRRTSKTAEDMYPNYAESPRKQHRYARERGGSWPDQEGSGGEPQSRPAPPPPRPPHRES